MFKHLFTRSLLLFRTTPQEDFISDYETLIRLARRCAYDLSHAVDLVPRSCPISVSLGMRERAAWWVSQFAKGNPGKDYRTRLMHRADELESKLEALTVWCEENNIKPPSNLISSKIPL